MKLYYRNVYASLAVVYVASLYCSWFSWVTVSPHISRFAAAFIMMFVIWVFAYAMGFMSMFFPRYRMALLCVGVIGGAEFIEYIQVAAFPDAKYPFLLIVILLAGLFSLFFPFKKDAQQKYHMGRISVVR